MTPSLEGAIERQLAARAPDAVVALGEACCANASAPTRRRCSSTAPAAARTTTPAASSISTSWSTTIARPTARCCRRSRTGSWPPNVYYLETSFAGRTVRAKYAVVSLDQFERGTARWFHPYLWGRFAQPCGLLFAADEIVRQRVVRALGAAVATFAARTLPRLPAEFDAETLWTRGLLLTYAAELRSERPAKIRALYADAAAELEALTHALAPEQGWTLAPRGRYRNPSTRASAMVERLRLGRAPRARQGAERPPPAEGVVHVRRRIAVPCLEDRAPLRSEDRDHALHAPSSLAWGRSARCGGRGDSADFGSAAPNSGISVGSGFPANHASRFALHRSPIACRVSRVALPTCGSSTTLSIARSGWRDVGLVRRTRRGRRP